MVHYVMPTLPNCMIQWNSMELTNNTTTTKSITCPQRGGVIIVNLLGLLANNLFQIAFANRLSQQLCWPVVYRKFWNAVLPSERAEQCLSNANLPQNITYLPISPSLQDDVQLNASTWEYWSLHQEEEANQAFQAWVERMAFQYHSVAELAHEEFDFTGNNVDKCVASLYSSKIQVVSLKAFFIHYDWMKEWMPKIRKWLQISPSCCQHSPPENAIVMHVRDFDIDDGGYNGIQPCAYVEIVKHVYTENNNKARPLWIVCQPKTRGSKFVQEVMASMGIQDVTIVTGMDQYDAFCTLARAKTLILSYVSSYSQMAALLNGNENVEVHYPLATLQEPEVTPQVPTWHYHLVNESLDGIQEWNVDYQRIQPKMA